MAESSNVMVRANIDFLRRHMPFDQMSRKDLDFLAASFKLAYFSRGCTITSSQAGKAATLYIVQSGLVRGVLESDITGQDHIEYGLGECFPLPAVLGERPTLQRYQALEDTFCLQTDAASVHELARRSAPFLEYGSNRSGALLRRSYASLRAVYAQQSTGEDPLSESLRELLRRVPITCQPDDSLRYAVKSMNAARVGSMIVVDAAGIPLGIFTERDLLRYTAQGDLDLDKPVTQYMRAPPNCLPASATAAEAAVLMARAGIRHVVVLEGRRLAGIVSERDLFALQRMSMRSILDAIGMAKDVDALVCACADIRKLATNMLAHGVAVEQLTLMIATQNERVANRILELETAHHDLEGIRFCWMALGSEGRLEQTLATDQDNAILFAAEAAPAQVRTRLLPVAAAVNRALDACGFPLCKGEIMAGNPLWCLSLAEWKQKFSGWIRDPLPKALLNAAIFFDLRGVWGAHDLAQDLQAWLGVEVRDNQRFLRAMAQVALESRPPLGLFADFVTTDAEGAPDSIDLKTQGTRPFVDAARIFAIASGCVAPSTAQRLRGSGEYLRIPRDEIEAAVEAFHFILLYRLRQQQHNPEHGNRIRPEALNELDRRILKEAFRQARKLQSRLALDYQL